jgi:hypothetical protein
MRFLPFGCVLVIAASFIVNSAFAQPGDGRVVCNMKPPEAVALSSEGRVGVDKSGGGLSWGEMDDSFFGCGDGRVFMIQELCAEFPWTLFDEGEKWMGRPNQDMNIGCRGIFLPWISAIRSDGQFALRMYSSEKPSEDGLVFEPLTYYSVACTRQIVYKAICAEFHARNQEFLSRVWQQKVATSELEKQNLSEESKRLTRLNKSLRNRMRRIQRR